jgi:CRP/FNR family transcriptional regulator
MLDCAHCPVRASAACAVLDEDERAAFAKAGRSITLAPGETLFHAGSTDVACATLIDGLLKIARDDADGNGHILSLIHPAGFVGELFSPFARHDVVALTEARLCIFAAADMEAAIARFPKLSTALLRRSQEDLHDTRIMLSLATRAGARTRIAGFLAELARAASHSPCHAASRFDLPLSRGQMGEMLGLTIETVSRQLSALEDQGIIRREGKRGIVVIDPAALDRCAA